MEKDCAKDDPEVIDERCEGLVDEDFAYQEAGADDSADEEKELCRQEEAGERGAESDSIGIEAMKSDTGVHGCEDLGHNDTEGEDNDHGVENDRESSVSSRVVALG